MIALPSCEQWFAIAVFTGLSVMACEEVFMATFVAMTVLSMFMNHLDIRD